MKLTALALALAFAMPAYAEGDAPEVTGAWTVIERIGSALGWGNTIINIYDWAVEKFSKPAGPRPQDLWYCQGCAFSPPQYGGTPDDVTAAARFLNAMREWQQGESAIVCNGSTCIGVTMKDGSFWLTTPPFKDPRIGYFNAPRSHNAAGGQGNYTPQTRAAYNPSFLPSTSGPQLRGSVTTICCEGISSGAGGGRGLLMGDLD